MIDRWSNEKTLREHIELRANNELLMHIKAIDSFFREKVNELNFIAFNPIVQKGNIPEILHYLERVQGITSTQVEGLYYNEVDGTVHDVKGGTFSVRDRYYYPAISRGETVITKVIKSRSTGRPIVLILVPIFNAQGERTGALGGTILVESLLDMIGNIKAGKTGYAMLVDEDNRVLSGIGNHSVINEGTSNPSQNMKSSDEGLDRLLQSISSRPGGFLRLHYRKEVCLVYFKTLPIMKWSLVLIYKENEILSDVIRMNRIYMLIIVSSLIFLGISIYGVQRILLNPIRTLVNAQRELGEGNPRSRAPLLSNDEIGMLSRSFNEMADQLQKHTMSLEKEVEERILTEQILRESEAAYRTIFDQSPNIIVLSKASGEIVDVNKKYLELNGGTPSDFLGKTSLEMGVISLEQHNTILEEMHRRNGELDQFEAKIWSPVRREWLDVLISLRAITIKNEPMVLSIVNDISERKRVEKDLMESEERFRSTFEQAAVGIAHVSPDGRFIRTNQRFCDIVGYTPDEIVTMTFQDITYPADLQADLDHVRELIEGSIQTYSIEKRYVRKDGSLVWINLTVALLRETDSKPKYFISVIEDIKNRKKAEEALRTSEQRFRGVLESLEKVAVQGYEPDGTISFWNRGSELAYGFSASEALGRNILDLLHVPESREVEQRIMDEALLTGNLPPTGEVDVINKDGQKMTIYASRILAHRPNGQTEFFCFDVDITEQKAAEAEIVEQRERLQGIAINVPGIVFQFYALLSGGYGMSYVSERATELLGLEVNIDTLFTEFVDRVHPDERQAFMASISEAVATVSPWHYEGQFMKPSGEIIWFSGASNPTLLPDRIVFNGMLLDITERKRAEEEMKRLQIQLIQAQKMESLGTLAGGIAHDFNNILAAIIGYSELAQSDLSDPEKVTAEIEQVLRAADRAKDLVSQILTFSRKTETTYSPLELPLLVKESFKMLRSVIPSTIEIHQNVIKSGLVMSNPTQIHQMIMNLCVNSAHAMEKSGGILTVSLKKEDLDSSAAQYMEVLPGHYLKLSISDTGHGISPEVMTRIFEPYFTTKDLGRGTGLGLSVVHGIVKSHGGAINCISTPGEGTTFDVYLPEIELVKGETDSREKEPIPTGSERILFIDDEPALADMVDKMLSKLGYQVTTRTSSADALILFNEYPGSFDLVISDMTMPVMTGDKLAQKIMEIRNDMPIILCTGYSEHISENKVKEIGISVLVMKPYETEDLAKAIRKALDKK